jgi:hypothetical protein
MYHMYMRIAPSQPPPYSLRNAKASANEQGNTAALTDSHLNEDGGLSLPPPRPPAPALHTHIYTQIHTHTHTHT